MTRKEQLQCAIELNKRQITESSNAECSRVGAKWIRQVSRRNIRNLRAELKELR